MRRCRSIASTLTYGTLAPSTEPILAKSFLLRSATDAEGKPVTMRKRTTREPIPAERGERVEFRPEDRKSVV